MKGLLITTVLDASGSMNNLREEMIGGYNSFIESLDLKSAPMRFSLYRFGGSFVDSDFVPVYEGVDEPLPLTKSNYMCAGMTALIDACCQAIDGADKIEMDEDVIVCIITDGQENASTLHSSKELRERIEQKKDAGWQFVFIGAGIDAFTEAGNIAGGALDGGMVANADKDKTGLANTYAALASNVGTYAVTRSAGDLQYSAKQRKSMSTKHEDI